MLSLVAITAANMARMQNCMCRKIEALGPDPGPGLSLTRAAVRLDRIARKLRVQRVLDQSPLVCRVWGF